MRFSVIPLGTMICFPVTCPQTFCKRDNDANKSNTPELKTAQALLPPKIEFWARCDICFIICIGDKSRIMQLFCKSPAVDLSFPPSWCPSMQPLSDKIVLGRCRSSQGRLRRTDHVVSPSLSQLRASHGERSYSMHYVQACDMHITYASRWSPIYLTDHSHSSSYPIASHLVSRVRSCF